MGGTVLFCLKGFCIRPHFFQLVPLLSLLALLYLDSYNLLIQSIILLRHFLKLFNLPHTVQNTQEPYSTPEVSPSDMTVTHFPASVLKMCFSATKGYREVFFVKNIKFSLSFCRG